MSNSSKQLYAFGDITEQDVRTMVQRYHDGLKNPPAFNENTYVKSVWFGIDQINYIHDRLKAENGDGVRLYFGNYPQKDSNGIDFPNPYTNTVIFVSTRKDGNYHLDYFSETYDTNPQDRGEQCQPNCNDTIPVNP